MKQKKPVSMLTKKPAQTARSNGADSLKNAPTVPLSVQNIRADERPLFDALWRLHQRQPDPEAYLEQIADHMRDYLPTAMHEVIDRHIAINRRDLQRMHTIDAWRDLFREAAAAWLETEYIPTRIEQIATTLANYGNEFLEKAYTQSRAATHAVSWLSDMGMVDPLCGYMTVIMSRRQAVMQERASASDTQTGEQP